MYSVTFPVNCLPNKVTSGQTFSLFCLYYLSTVHLVTKRQWTWICQSTSYKSSWAAVNKIRATYLAGEKLAGENTDWAGLLVTDVCLLLMAVSGVVCGLLIEPFEENNITVYYHLCISHVLPQTKIYTYCQHCLNRLPDHASSYNF